MKLYRLLSIETEDKALLQNQINRSLATGIHTMPPNSSLSITDWLESIPTEEDLANLESTGVYGCISKEQLDKERLKHELEAKETKESSTCSNEETTQG